MTQETLMPEAAAELWSDDIWDWLLDSIDEQSVIPIVGPDLLDVEVDGKTTLLDHYVAGQLAFHNKLSLDNLVPEKASIPWCASFCRGRPAMSSATRSSRS